MIRFIAAIDSKNGIADDHGIPWKGKLPTDVAYYRGKIKHHNYLIGYGTYANYTKPIPDTKVFVATSKSENLRAGYSKITDPRDYLLKSTEDVWVGGGSVIYRDLLDLADELYLTRVEGDFGCTKFFPEFENEFILASEFDKQIENDINFRFQIWQRR